jgi:hypothetical protein
MARLKLRVVSSASFEGVLVLDNDYSGGVMVDFQPPKRWTAQSVAEFLRVGMSVFSLACVYLMSIRPCRQGDSVGVRVAVLQNDAFDPPFASKADIWLPAMGGALLAVTFVRSLCPHFLSAANERSSQEYSRPFDSIRTTLPSWHTSRPQLLQALCQAVLRHFGVDPFGHDEQLCSALHALPAPCRRHPTALNDVALLRAVTRCTSALLLPELRKLHAHVGEVMSQLKSTRPLEKLSDKIVTEAEAEKAFTCLYDVIECGGRVAPHSGTVFWLRCLLCVNSQLSRIIAPGAMRC